MHILTVDKHINITTHHSVISVRLKPYHGFLSALLELWQLINRYHHQYSTVGVLVMVSSELVVLLIVCVSTGSTQGDFKQPSLVYAIFVLLYYRILSR